MANILVNGMNCFCLSKIIPPMTMRIDARNSMSFLRLNPYSRRFHPFQQSLADHVTPVCAHDWPEGLSPRVSIPQIETPNSGEILRRSFTRVHQPLSSDGTHACAWFLRRSCAFTCTVTRHGPGCTIPVYITYSAPFLLS